MEYKKLDSGEKLAALIAREEQMREVIQSMAVELIASSALIKAIGGSEYGEADDFVPPQVAANRGAVERAQSLAPIAAEPAAPVAQPVACVECGGPLQWRCPACRIAQSRAVAQPVARAKE